MTGPGFRPPVVAADRREGAWGEARLRRGERAVPTPLAAGALALAAATVGAVLAVAGGRAGAAGPLVVAGLPVLGVLVAAALRYPVVAVAGVALSIAAGERSVAGGLLPLVQAAALLAAGVVGLRRLTAGRGPLPFPAPAWWGLGLLVQMLLSTAGAPELGVALRRDASVLVGLLLALAVAGACRDVRDVRRVTAALLGAGGVVCGLGLLLSGRVSATAGAVNVAGSRGVFSEHNQAGSFAAAVLLLAVGAALAARTSRGRLAAGAVGLLALLQVGLSLSRGAWLGCIAGLLALLVLQPRARRVLLRLSLPLLLALGVAATATPASTQLQIVGERFGSIGQADKNPYDDRTTIWAEAVREFRTAPLLGQGPGAFPEVSSRSASRARTVSALHAHNVPLDVAAELGAPGLGLLVGFTLALGLAALRASRRLGPYDGSLAAGVGAALATFAGQGVVDVTLLSALIATLLWLLVGLALALSQTPGSGQPGSGQPRTAPGASGPMNETG